MPRAPRLIAALAALLVASHALPARADREHPATAPPADDPRFACGKPKATFAVSFKDDVELRDLVAWAMGFSCKRFVYASGLAGRAAKLTLITPGTVSGGDAWAIFEIGLAAMGLTAIAKGGVLEIVESAQAKDEALAIRRGFPDGGGEEVVRALVRPAHVGVDDLRAAIELVKSRYGVVTALPALHAILVTDDARHVARMKTLVAELDQPADGAGVYAVPVAHRDAVELVTALQPLIAEGGDGKPSAAGPRLSADRRVNAVFVVGSAADHRRVRALVDALDVADGDDVRVQAVRLRNASAKDVAATLAPLLAAGGGAAATTTSAAPAGPVKLTADDGTNALLFLASARDAIAVRAMIAELDAPRRQVYIEATVLEVEASTERALGVSWHGGTSSGGTTSVGGFQTGTLSSLAAADSVAGAGAGLFAGLFGDSISLLGQTLPSFGALVAASDHSSRLDVLASPHLMALDNKPATISIGTNIPYKSAAASTAGSLVSSQAQIQRQKVALTLTLTPHVAPAAVGEADGDRIRIDVDLEDAQLGTENYGDDLGPTWKERKLQTSIVLHDQDSLVLGGLIDERSEQVRDAVPILGALPLLGVLFRSTKTIKQKSNLLIVLTPYLVDDGAAGRRILEQRERERDEFLRARSDLATRPLAPRVDYRRKRGVIAEIDATVRATEREHAALAAIARPAPPRGRIDDADPPGDHLSSPP